MLTTNGRNYAVGQSPSDEASCKNFVLQGVESGQGVFQFVSTKAHRFGEDSKGKTMAVMLQEMLDKNESNPIELNGRYSLTSISQNHDGSEDGRSFSLTVTDNDSPTHSLTIPLVQAGYKFTNKLLDARQIDRASKLLDMHQPPSVNENPLDQCDPLILSTAGYGRNAVLMTYREICRQIEGGTVRDKAQLREALKPTIDEGREFRSPHFVHSEAQLWELYKALEEKLQGVSPRRVSLDSPGASAVAQSLRDVASTSRQGETPPQPYDDVLQGLSIPSVEDEIIITQKILEDLSKPENLLAVDNILECRNNPEIIKNITDQFNRTLKAGNLVLNGSVVVKSAGIEPSNYPWILSSADDKAFSTAIRSMSLFGNSLEAKALFNVLKENINSNDKDIRINAFRAALLKPELLSKPGDTYESYLFPCKTLPDLAMFELNPKKEALFKQQNILYAEHRSHANAPVAEPPLKAFFSKAATVDSYRDGNHLEKEIGDPDQCKVSSDPDFYFASKKSPGAGAASVSQPVPRKPVYEVHVDFANSCLGGSWKRDNNFAQEEIVFTENVGLGAIASYAQEEGMTALAHLTNDNFFKKEKEFPAHYSYGRNFLTRRPDNNAPAPILIEGAERVANFLSYGGKAADLDKDELIGETYKKIDDCLQTNWLAIAAPNHSRDAGGKRVRPDWKQAKETEIDSAFMDIFSTAHAGFAMAKNNAGNERDLRIHTGQFGCGAFANNLVISTAAQMLAAKVVGVNEIIFHHYNDEKKPGHDSNKELVNKIDKIISERLSNNRDTTTAKNLIELVLTDLSSLLPDGGEDPKGLYSTRQR
ncbi:hypothetical protein IMCC9480_589 [Oxalobacteraceae bacterium IMCC9480]|nr:hypothetical protein IMCC9480_589 [Oxalobacteraceae bacterium IMCC9480]